MSRTVQLATVGAALALSAAAPAAAFADDGSVQPAKSSYGLGEAIDITWAVPAGQEVEFWMEPAGSPLVNSPKGSMHFDTAPTGHYALENPGGGRWEVHWELLGAGVVHRSRTFTVGAAAGGGGAKVRTGHYGCYTTTTLGLTRSSIDAIEITSRSRYKALGGRGRYRFSKSTAKLKLRSGPLKHRVARFEGTGKEAKIIFRRTENERRGRPTIDISDTYCYFGRD